MSYSCLIEMETSLSEREVLGFAAAACNGEITEDSSGKIFFRVPGAAASVCREEIGNFAKNLMFEYYGFRHNLWVNFTIFYGEDPERKITVEPLRKSIPAILGNVEGKAVVVWDHGKTILERTGETTYISSHESEDWLAEAYDQAGLEYERKFLEPKFN